MWQLMLGHKVTGIKRTSFQFTGQFWVVLWQRKHILITCKQLVHLVINAGNTHLTTNLAALNQMVRKATSTDLMILVVGTLKKLVWVTWICCIYGQWWEKEGHQNICQRCINKITTGVFLLQQFTSLFFPTWNSFCSWGLSRAASRAKSDGCHFTWGFCFQGNHLITWRHKWFILSGILLVEKNETQY